MPPEHSGDGLWVGDSGGACSAVSATIRAHDEPILVSRGRRVPRPGPSVGGGSRDGGEAVLPTDMHGRDDAGRRRPASADALEILRKGGGGLLVRGVATVLAMATHLAISRIWGAASLGVYTLAVTLAYTAALVCRVGTDGAAVRFVAAAPGAARTVYRRVLTVTLPLSAGVAVAIWASAPLLAERVFAEDELVGPIRALAAALPLLGLLSAAAACLQGRRRVVLAEAMQGALPPALTLLLLGVAAWRGAFAPGVPAYARAGAIAGAAGAGALAWHLAAARGAGRGAEGPAAPSVRRLLRTAGPMFVSSSLYSVLTTTDTFVLGIYRDSDEVGFYRAATSIALAISFAPSALYTIAAPMFAEAYWSGQRQRLEHLVAVTARAALGASAAVALGLFALSVPILRLFGDGFVAAAPGLVVYGAGLVASTAFGPTAVVLNMIGEERALSRYLVVAVAVGLLLNLALVPRWGILGAATATAAGTILWNALAAARAHGRLGHPIGPRLLRGGPRRSGG